VESDFDLSGGASGSWWEGLSNLTGQVLAYKALTSPTSAFRPYSAAELQFIRGANGELIQRGVPASSLGLGNLASLVPLALIAVVVVLAVRALR